MRSAARRARTGSIAAFAVFGLLLGGSIAFAAPLSAGIGPTHCVATITPGPTVTSGTDQTLTVTGLTPNGGYEVTSTHNGTVAGPSPGTADATGGVSFTQTYALGTWTYTYSDNRTEASCSVSWTVIAETTTTPTTTPTPTTTAPAVVGAQPTFTG
jgi:hypothetical protein